MGASDREFINALILREKPKKVLKIGISSGASSILIANALKETSSFLYSIDLSNTYYREPEKSRRIMQKKEKANMKTNSSDKLLIKNDTNCRRHLPLTTIWVFMV